MIRVGIPWIISPSRVRIASQLPLHLNADDLSSCFPASSRVTRHHTEFNLCPASQFFEFLAACYMVEILTFCEQCSFHNGTELKLKFNNETIFYLHKSSCTKYKTYGYGLW